VTLNDLELASLSAEIHEMLGSPKSIKIRSWEITGRLDSFDDDVIVGDPLRFIDHLRRRSDKGQ